jgi:hypothetical protein
MRNVFEKDIHMVSNLLHYSKTWFGMEMIMLLEYNRKNNHE